MWQNYTRTFIAITLTTGYLLGWALPSVLNRFLPFHKVVSFLGVLMMNILAKESSREYSNPSKMTFCASYSK
jgi:Na+/glutamate symporter